MKKKVLLGLVALMACTSVSLAAPAVEVKKGELMAGYTYYRMQNDVNDEDEKANLGSGKTDSYYVQYGLDNKWILGVEYNQSSNSKAGKSLDFKTTDITVRYAMDKNVNLILGSRKYDITAIGNGESGSGNTNKMLYGITGKVNLDRKLDGYATILKTSYETQWQIGTVYNFTKDLFLDVNYKHQKISGSDTDIIFKGVGIGMGHRF